MSEIDELRAENENLRERVAMQRPLCRCQPPGCTERDEAKFRIEAVKAKRDEIVREAVRVSAEHLRTTHWDGNGCGTNGASGCSRCYGPSPADAAEVAEDVMDAAWPVFAAALSGGLA